MPITINIATKFISGSDTPSSYAGQAGKKVVVNSTEDGLIFVDDNSGSGSTTTHTIDPESFMQILNNEELITGDYYTIPDLFHVTYKAISPGIIEPFFIPIYKPIEEMYNTDSYIGSAFTRGVICINRTYNEGDYVIFYGKIYVKTSGGTQQYLAYAEDPYDINTQDFYGWELVDVDSDLYVLKNFKFELPLKNIQRMTYKLFDDYGNTFFGEDLDKFYLAVHSDNRKDIYFNECVAINNNTNTSDGNSIIYRNRLTSGVISDNCINFCGENTIKNSIYYNTDCNYILRNESPCQLIQNNLAVKSIEYNSNSGSIESNENVEYIGYNKNYGDIIANYEVDRINYNTNQGSIETNSKLTEITNNSNLGEIYKNTTFLEGYYPSIHLNSNLGDISSNTILGDILLNSNVGAIDDNHINDSTTVEHKYTQKEVSIYKNSNKGDIITNSISLGIILNSNLGDIKSNYIIGNISYNDNLGNIHGNVLGDISSDFGGSIAGNSNSGDISDNINISSDFYYCIGVNTNAGSITKNGDSFLTTTKMIIANNCNNGYIHKCSLPLARISENSNNGNISTNISTFTLNSIVGNYNNGTIANIFSDSSVEIMYNSNNGDIISPSRATSLIGTRTNL